MGSEQASIEYLVKNADVPFEGEEKACLKVIKKLINWEWGVRALYGNAMAVAYILNRGGKTKEILEIKYRIV